MYAVPDEHHAVHDSSGRFRNRIAADNLACHEQQEQSVFIGISIDFPLRCGAGAVG